MDLQHEPKKNPTLAKRLPSWTLLALLIASFTYMADCLLDVQLRMENLESMRLDESLRIHRNVHSQFVELDDKVELQAKDGQLAVELSQRLKNTEARVGNLGQDIQDQASKLVNIEDRQHEFGPREMAEGLAEGLAEYGAAHDSRWESIVTQMASVESNALEASAAVQRLGANPAAERDLNRMWNELVAPIVQLTGEVSVGSGVLLKSREDEATGGFLTHVLTAWHVVRDIQGDLTKTEMPIPVTVYSEDGQTEKLLAELLVFNPGLDAALLQIRSEAPFVHGASLASPARLASLEIFDQVYAVGCPLGNDPIPTAGEIATVQHEVDGSSYMMINAPTYIGNSGGGIFDSTSHELLGIFSKIYTHGSLRPTIVPHMGLVTPLNHIYTWLETEGYASVIPEEQDAHLASR